MHVHVFTPCFQCMLVHVFNPCFSAYKYQYICIVYDNRSTDVPLIVHKSLYTIMFFFYDKLVVDMCIYTLAIDCMYSLHACSFIHSMFSVHACSCFYCMFSVHTITNICASSTTTDRLMFHELFPCKYSCAYSSSCAHTNAHYIVVFFNCITHIHVYVHHCLHVFTASLFM